jgi:REP element-mobilizing transposase RayT
VVQRERQPLPIYVHLVWATWNRLPLLSEEMSKQVYHAVGAKCRELGAQVVAIGGTEDHVHLLVRLPATLSVADLLKHIKGASSHLVTHRLAPGQSFKWQGSYGACSVSPRHLAQVSDYIARQREHHATGTLIATLEHEPSS